MILLRRISGRPSSPLNKTASALAEAGGKSKDDFCLVLHPPQVGLAALSLGGCAHGNQDRVEEGETHKRKADGEE